MLGSARSVLAASLLVITGCRAWSDSDTARVVGPSEKKASETTANLSPAALARLNATNLPNVHDLERVYWRTRFGMQRGRAKVTTYASAWPCLWGEEPTLLGRGDVTQPNEINEWKWVCGLRAIRSPQCVVYSAGSYGETTFEQSIKAARPDCHVITMDVPLYLPPPEAAARHNITLEPYWLASKSGTQSLSLKNPTTMCQPPECDPSVRTRRTVTVAYTTLAEVMLRHQHDHIDILKLDIDGAEYGVVPSLPSWLLARVGQIQMEIHSLHESRVEQVIAPLESAGFRVFSIEPNFRNGCCAEYSLISMAWHPEQFADRHEARQLLRRMRKEVKESKSSP